MKFGCKSLLAAGTAAVLTLSLSAPALAAETNGIAVQLDGANVVFTDAVPEVLNQRTFLPFRAVFEAMGAKAGRIIGKHLLPNALSVIIINVTLAVPSAIFTEAFLSYIGLGVPVPQPSWGMLAQEGASVFQLYPHQLWIPAIAISLTMLSFNLLGDGLRDAFDPRLRR